MPELMPFTIGDARNNLTEFELEYLEFLRQKRTRKTHWSKNVADIS